MALKRLSLVLAIALASNPAQAFDLRKELERLRGGADATEAQTQAAPAAAASRLGRADFLDASRVAPPLTTSTPTSFAMDRRQITTVIAGPALLATVRRIPLSAHARRPRPRGAAADRRAATEIGAPASSSYRTPDLDSAPFPLKITSSFIST